MYFSDEDYIVHTKCITEDERYAAKNSIPIGIPKKGELKQETWLEMISSIIAKETNLKPAYRNLLNAVASYTNVPRKKAKFIVRTYNFQKYLFINLYFVLELYHEFFWKESKPK